MEQKIFGSRLREEREKIGLSQPALAEQLGVSKQTVQNWEGTGGRATPMPSDKLDICAKLAMDVQYIITGTRSANLLRVAEEDAPKYRAEPVKKQVDPEVLQGVIAGVKEYLNDTGRTLSPAKETELVMLLLDFMNAENVQNKSSVREAVAKVIEFKFKRG